jgi:hypothetical protein
MAIFKYARINEAPARVKRSSTVFCSERMCKLKMRKTTFSGSVQPDPTGG